ncbi:MAG: glutamyl-tRNA reductase [Deltaproteobacteria bacterium]|jgi:glutamyl-tRNA reductase|nr:glutamyl-tRNA reductase [Deltaproteobacteria bacterium]
MEIFVYGAAHWRAPVEIREKLAKVDLSGSKLYRLFATDLLSETLVLATCNRLEIVGVAQNAAQAKEAFLNECASQTGLDPHELDQMFHFYEDLEAVRYLFRVTSGLDSQVLGEPQILGQVKESFREALKSRLVGPVVGKLFHKSFKAAKRARAETDFALGSVSLASAAVETAAELMGSLAGRKALILGAGEMAGLLAAHLSTRKLKSLTVLNRNAAKAQELADKWGASSLPLTNLVSALQESDLVFSAVGGLEPVLTAKGLAPIAVNKNLWLLDLGVPRNIEAKVGDLEGVTLKNIDEIAALVQASRLARSQEAQKVEAIIEEELSKFSLWLSGLGARPTIKSLTQLADEARAKELERTLAKNDFTPAQAKALEAMGRALTRRILHNPLAFAKSCHRHGRTDQNLDLLRRIFGLDP